MQMATALASFISLSGVVSTQVGFIKTCPAQWGMCAGPHTSFTFLKSSLNINCAFVSRSSSLKIGLWIFHFTFQVSPLPEKKWDYGEIVDGVSDREWMCSSNLVPSYIKFDRQEKEFSSIRTGLPFNV